MNKIAFFLLFPVMVIAQKSPVEIKVEEGDFEITLIASNKGFCPFTIDLTAELTNMEALTPLPRSFVIPAGAFDFQLVTFKVIHKKKGYQFGYQTSTKMGNTVDPPDTSFYAYALPYPKDQKFIMSQGYNGPQSHFGLNALDFTMPIGTPIHAIRDGIVIAIKENSNKGCNDPICMDQANYIILYHEDGTFSEYAHLKKNGVKVKPGESIVKGQLIGFSGNTGYRTGPHLHLEVYHYSGSEKITLRTPFQIADYEVDYLIEGRKY
ncbi:MAG: M23 family metallopeptidase [Cyclobacteriaceae bacterium]